MRKVLLVWALIASGVLAGCSRSDSKPGATAVQRPATKTEAAPRAKIVGDNSGGGTATTEDVAVAESDNSPSTAEPPLVVRGHQFSDSLPPPPLPRLDPEPPPAPAAEPMIEPMIEPTFEPAPTATAPATVHRHGNPLRRFGAIKLPLPEHAAPRPGALNPLRSDFAAPHTTSPPTSSPPPLPLPVQPPRFMPREPRIPLDVPPPAAKKFLGEPESVPTESAVPGAPSAPETTETQNPSGGAAPDFARDDEAPSSPEMSSESPVEPPTETSAEKSAVTRQPQSFAAPLVGMPLADESFAPAPLAGATVGSADPTSNFKVMKVFYGTDRRQIGASGANRVTRLFAMGPLVVMMVLSILAAAGAVYSRFHKTLAVASVAGILISIGLIVAQRRSDEIAARAAPADDASPSARRMQYGSERGELQVGVCEVSIPNIHEAGKLEGPSILRLEVRPDPDKHIVVQRVETLANKAFFAAVRDRVAQSPHKDLFIFVHGYNISFDTAARRTAQIAKDVDFQGAAIFYSWPSQNDLLGYTVDEQNVSWTVTDLKRFLLDVVQRSEARSISLIAHSMGNRAITNALRQLEGQLKTEQRIFHEIVLAAPDIDADEFKRDIAPALTRAAQHVTLYASSHDQALVASRFVHGYARAGDSGEGIVVVPGIETVDVSRIDTSLLGHSYYGGCGPIIKDLTAVLRDFRSAPERTWLRSAERDGVTYWIYDSAPATVRAPAGDVR